MTLKWQHQIKGQDIETKLVLSWKMYVHDKFVISLIIPLSVKMFIQHKIHCDLEQQR